MVNVGIIGIGGMGRMHFNCYRNNPNAKIVAICDVDARKREGDWSSIGLNIDTSKSDRVDLSGITAYSDYHELIADPSIQIVDICLPTSLHAEVATAALRAGKDVLCEKPMVRLQSEIEPLLAAYQESGQRLLIGHCLRYWGQYVKAAEIIASGDYGKPLYATFHRSGGEPKWSWKDWLRTGSESGGVILDMHVHDIDAAVWWFGRPDAIKATGLVRNDLAVLVDTTWTYENGPLVQLHSAWDLSDVPFHYSFRVVMEHATIKHDSLVGQDLTLYQPDKPAMTIESDLTLAYQREIDDLVDAVETNRSLNRVTPQSSAIAVEIALEELRQVSE